jgi:hypothetical protein
MVERGLRDTEREVSELMDFLGWLWYDACKMFTMERAMSIQTHDRDGRPYAKLSELKSGDKIELDCGFTCVAASILGHGGYRTLFDIGKGLAFACNDGHHYLAGQADDGEHCVGVYGPIR